MQGCYVHGLFADAAFRTAWLAWAGADSTGFDHDVRVEQTLDALADHLAAHVDLDALLALSG